MKKLLTLLSLSCAMSAQAAPPCGCGTEEVMFQKMRDAGYALMKTQFWAEDGTKGTYWRNSSMSPTTGHRELNLFGKENWKQAGMNGHTCVALTCNMAKPSRPYQ